MLVENLCAQVGHTKKCRNGVLPKGDWVLTASPALARPRIVLPTSAVEGLLGPFVLGADPHAPTSQKGM